MTRGYHGPSALVRFCGQRVVSMLAEAPAPHEAGYAISARVTFLEQGLNKPDEKAFDAPHA